MARITGSGSDAIFSIRRFLGVNQAQEGEASLKTGEAAVCRNFRITSGGALRKRPGSSDVADLTTSYNVGTDRDSQSPLLESTGLLVAPLTMYPRISASPQGLVQTEGEARSVDTENWEEHAGEYYVHSDGMPWQLRSVETVPGDGNIQVAGGHIDLSDAMPVAVGEWDDTSGELDASGDQYIDVYPELACTGQTFSPRGEPVRIEPTEPVPAGWITQDQTGYFEYYGTPYAYYGLKSEQLTGYILWGRYQCTRQAHGQEYTYYTQGQWQDAGSGTASWASGSVSGYTGYVFDSVTGLFSGTGSSITLYGGDSGIVYEIEGSLCRKVTFTATSVVESATVSQVSQAQGPFTGTETEYTYTLGDKTGSEAYPAGDYPGESQGLEFTDTFTNEGVEYTVMTDGESFFAFAQEGERCDWTFAFYGRPITGEADSYTFIMSPTWSEPNTSQDTAVQGIWSGAVAGDQVLCAACNGNLWELEYTPPSERDTGGWHRNSCGLLDTSRDVRMFGFQDKLYILNGRDYLVWDGSTLKQVEGYRPLVVTEAAPEGGGNTLEQVNKLTGARRGWWSPDGEASVFHLPESPVASVDYVEDRTLGARFAAEDYTVDLAAGTVTFAQAPESGVDSVEIGWSVSESGRDLVTSMTCAELYNGAQDSRVFLYGDGTNTCIYSGLDTNGQPRADYFPDLNEAAIGDSNTPITAMIRHYSSLLAFKLDSSWSVNYDTLTLPDGSVTAGST